jgi:hypothetical protein
VLAYYPQDAHACTFQVCISISSDITVVGRHVDKMVAAAGQLASKTAAPELLFNSEDALDPGTGKVGVHSFLCQLLL